MSRKNRRYALIVVLLGSLCLALVPPRPAVAATCWDLDSREPEIAQAGEWLDAFAASVSSGGHLLVKNTGAVQHTPPRSGGLSGRAQPPAEVTFSFEPPRQICKDQPTPAKLIAQGPNRMSGAGVYMLAMGPDDVVDGSRVDAKALLQAAGGRGGRPSSQNVGFQVGKSVTNSENNGLPTGTPQESAFDIVQASEPVAFRLSVYTTSGYGPGVFEAAATWRYSQVDTTKPPVRVDHTEFVQVVQDPGNGIPLVAGKHTVARTFVAATGQAPVGGVTGTLTVRREGAAPVTLQPKAPITAQVNFDREDIAHSLMFDIPAAVTAAGTVSFDLRLSVPGVSGPAADDPRLKQTTVATFKQPANWPDDFQLVGLRICTQDPPTPLPTKAVPNPPTPANATVVCPSDATTLQPLTGLLVKLYPVADSTVGNYIAATTPLTYPYPLKTPSEQDALVAYVRKAYDLVFGNGRIWRGDQVVGWIAEGADTTDGDFETFGMSDPTWGGKKGGTQGHVMWVKDRTPRANGALATQRTVAHEIGHNLGLRHTNVDKAAAQRAGCGSIDPATKWPYRDGVTIHETGFDPAAGIVRSAKMFDLMAYCPPDQTWISPHDFSQLLAANAQRPETLAPGARRAVSGATPADYLVISGSVRRVGGEGRLDPAYVISDSTSDDDSNPAGRYCVRLTGGQSAAAACFDLDFKVDEREEPIDEEFFSIKLPWIADTTEVTLTDGSRELARRTAGSTNPTVSITAPSAGGVTRDTMTLQWTAQGAAATTILYSFDDRQTWYPLAIDIAAPQLEIDTHQLAAGDHVYFRVLITDGLRSASADVGPMQLPDGRKDGFPGAMLGTGGPDSPTTLPVRALALGVVVAVTMVAAGSFVLRRRLQR